MRKTKRMYRKENGRNYRRKVGRSIIEIHENKVGGGVDSGPAACHLSFLHDFVQLLSHDIQIGKFLKLFNM